MRVLVAHNPVSGRGNANKLSADISDALMHEGCEVDCLLTQADDPKKWLEPKLKQVDRVVAVGGDGTLRSIASCLVGTGIPIYHAPSGTENLFAKSMRMSNDAQKVVKSVLEGDVQRIDTATANGEFLLLMSSMGFDAEVVADLAANRGQSITHMSYLMPCIRKFLKFSPPVVSITVDDVEVVQNRRGWVVVANSPAYAMGLNPARNASTTDSLLDVVFLPIRSRTSLIRWISRVNRGMHLQHKNAIELRGKNIQINTAAPTHWQLDGDPAGSKTSQLSVVIRPCSLAMIT